MIKKILLGGKVLVLVLISKTSFSQIANVNKSLHYQGAVRTSVGLPLGNKNITVRSSIIDGSATGTVVYWEVRDIKTNGLGLYSFNIGDGNDKSKSGSFENINWSNNNTKYIKIEVDPNAGTNFSVSGVQPLASVPYALTANNITGKSITVGNIIPGNPNQVLTTTPDGKDVFWKDAAGTVNLNGDVTGPSNATVIKDGAVTATKLANGAITGDKIGNMGATAGQVLKFNAITGKWEPANDDNTMYNGSLSVSLDPTTQTFTRAALTGDVTAAANTNTVTVNNGAITADKIGAGAVTGDKIAAGALTTDKIADGAITGIKIAGDAIDGTKIIDGSVNTVDLTDGAVTADKLNDMGAANGQVLTYNTITNTWEPTTIPAGAIYNGSPSVSLDPASNTFTRPALTGDVTAAANSNTLTIATGAVTATKIAVDAVDGSKIINGTVTGADLATNTVATGNLAPGAVTGDKISTAGASNGQVLTFNGTTWAPTTIPAGATYNGSPSVALDLTTNTFTRPALTGDVTAAANSNALTIAPGAVTGDKISTTGANNGQVLTFNGTTWAPTTPAAGTVYSNSTSVLANGSTFERAALTGDVNAAQNSNTLTIATGAVTGDKILDNSIVNADIAATAAIATSKLAPGTSNQVLTTNAAGNATEWKSADAVGAEPWLKVSDNSKATSVNDNIYVLGKVGIGNTAPVSQLANTNTQTLDSDNDGVNAGSLSWSTSDAGHTGLFFNSVGSALMAKTTSTATTTAILDLSTGVKDTQGTPVMRVRSDGKVGIGTISPTQQLHITGNARIEQLADGTSYTDVVVADANGVLGRRTIASLGGGGAATPQVFTSNTDDVTLTAAADYTKPFLYGGASGSLATTGSKLYFDPNKDGAFRSGKFSSTQVATIGNGSAAFGGATEASGLYSFAVGQGSKATKVNGISMGLTNNVSGTYSVGIGSDNIVSGSNSVALGRQNKISGTYSFVLGNINDVKNSDAVAIGSSNIVDQIFGTAIGNWNRVRSYGETVMGYYNADYTPIDAAGVDPKDRLFVIGNGNNGATSNALTMLKDGFTGLGVVDPSENLDVAKNARIRQLNNADVDPTTSATYTRKVVAKNDGTLGYVDRAPILVNANAPINTVVDFTYSADKYIPTLLQNSTGLPYNIDVNASGNWTIQFTGTSGTTTFRLMFFPR